MNEVKKDFESRLNEDKSSRISTEQDIGQHMLEIDETNAQLAQDIDVEILELRDKYTTSLAADQDATLKYKGENGIMKKKFNVLTQDIDDQRDMVKHLLDCEQGLHEAIKTHAEHIVHHKREIRVSESEEGAGGVHV